MYEYMCVFFQKQTKNSIIRGHVVELNVGVMCMCGCMGVRVYGCMSVWVYECMGEWVYGCMGVWVYWVYWVYWVHGCMGVWVYGCMGVCVYESSDSPSSVFFN